MRHLAIAIGILSVAGYLAYLAAAQILPLAPVSALRESSVIFGTVIGAILFPTGIALVTLRGEALIFAPIIGSLIVVAAVLLFAVIVFQTCET